MDGEERGWCCAALLVPRCQGSAVTLALLLLPPAWQSALPAGMPVLAVAPGVPLQLGSVRGFLQTIPSTLCTLVAWGDLHPSTHPSIPPSIHPSVLQVIMNIRLVPEILKPHFRLLRTSAPLISFAVLGTFGGETEQAGTGLPPRGPAGPALAGSRGVTFPQTAGYPHKMQTKPWGLRT